jgi:hypothetical protein
MKSIVTLPAHYDGSRIVLDAPYELKSNDKLLVTLLQPGTGEEEKKEWTESSLSHLNDAYGKNEPEYSISLVKEPNPDYGK